MLRMRLLVVLTLAALVAAPAAAQTEIVWWHAMGGALGEKVNEIAAGFNESQDEYVVTPVYRGSYAETMTGAIAAFRAGEQPHIVQVFEVGTATMMAAEGGIYPVHELMGKYAEGWNPDAYLPAVISYYVSDEGNLLSLPFNSSTPVLWYNQDALDELGLEVPTTWEELEAAANTAVENGWECGMTSAWQTWIQLENFSAWHDLPFATLNNGYGGLGTEMAIDNEGVINHIAQLQRMTENNAFVYPGRESAGEPMFLNQECVFFFNSSAGYGAINTGADFEFGQTMMPVDTRIREEPQNSIIGGATLWVLQGHEEEEYRGVARFFEYLSTPEVQADWHQFTGYVPITLAAYELSQEQGFYEENPGTDTAIKQLTLNEPTPNSRGIRLGNFVQIRTVMDEELEAVWSGQKTPEEAINAIVQRGNELLRQFERANR
ncbi:MAG TPA: sn-glycerol-3-phosphate ABC transporter substrate-binding protein UgpB [Trueperaceae bacterium]